MSPTPEELRMEATAPWPNAAPVAYRYQRDMMLAAADRIEALEAAASVPPPSADAMKVLVRTMVEDVDLEMSSDLGSCAYYLRCQKVEGYEDGICTFGCREEPSCITDEPADGWPSSAPDFDYRRAWADSFTEYLLANVAAVPSSQEPTE